MSWVRVWVHFVFSTKYRKPFLSTKELRCMVFEHIEQNAKTKDIWLDCVNGYDDHVHCLVNVRATQTIGNIAKLIKGESSYWINQNKLIDGKFVWQDDYWAASVSESRVKTLRGYIHRQEEKHAKTHFSQEVEEFMEEYGLKVVKGD